jgi:DNA polymerase III subunit epsilon
VRVHGLRERDVAEGVDPEAAIRQLLDFIGSRPLVGYFLEFDVAMLNREMWRALGVHLPQPKIEVSAMYYDYKNRQLPSHDQGGNIDLRFATMMTDLGLPLRGAHNALDDAVMAGLAFVKLRHLGANPG